MCELIIIKHNLIKICKTMGYQYMWLPLTLKDNKLRSDLTSAMHCVICENMFSYKYGTVYRTEKHIGLGRYNQFDQFDFDIIGLKGLSCEMLIFIIIYLLIEYLNFKTYCKLVLNHVYILYSLGDKLGILNYPSKQRIATVALDKAMSLDYLDLISILTNGRYDSSGDFVCGANLDIINVSMVLHN